MKTDLNITEISFKSGYNNIAHFNIDPFWLRKEKNNYVY
jgi:hypothetical protein